MKTLLEWLFTNQQSLPDGIYTVNQFGHVFCNGMMVHEGLKPTFNKYGKVNKRIKKL